jgi:hypothetical protein
MHDISNLEKRITSIERLSVLNNLENGLVNTDVIDAVTGLNRFKSGYLVDDFANPFLISDNYVINNNASFFNKRFGPRKEGFIPTVNIYASNGSANYQNTNGQFTLPFTETNFIKQNTSTKSLSVNPFSAISWEGILTIGPEFDLSIMNRNLTKTVQAEVVVPPAAYIEPPPPPEPVIAPPSEYVPPDEPVYPPPPPPEEVPEEVYTIGVLANNLGLSSDNSSNVVVQVEVSQRDYTYLSNNYATGEPFSAAIDAQRWADVYVAALVSASDGVGVGSANWEVAKQNAISYLEDNGYDNAPVGEGNDKKKIHEILYEAYYKAVDGMGYKSEDDSGR